MSFSDTTIDEAEVAKFSAIAEQWWDEEGKFKPLHRINPLRVGYIRDHAIAHFGLPADNFTPLSTLTLFDVGCGGGLICEPMRRLGATVTGLDASEKNIKTAHVHAKNMGLEIDYRHGSVEALAASGAQYDIVLNLEVVEHVADVSAFLKASATLVKPGGMMVLSTLNRTFKAFALAIVGAEYVLRWLPRGTHDWQKFLTPAEVTHHLWEQGLELQHLTGMVMHPLTQAWRLDERDVSVNYLLMATKPLA
jgi:2-polyprenyl-6-hydroxyphenyl methylase/3-demethylubiquinone-9 3-methyltransferase